MEKEVHYHTSGNSGGDGGSGAMIGLIAGIVLVALGAFLWFGVADRGTSTASGPNVTTTAPSTTGQGGGSSGVGDVKK